MEIQNKIDINAPIKWKKHLILPLFGLRSFEELESEIHRYSACDVEKIVADILKDMQKAEERGESNLYIVSLISKNKLIKLPNVQIRDKDKLEEFRERYSASNPQYDELWFTKKQRTKDASSLVGRVSFRNSDYKDDKKRSQGDEQCIEQVWNSSHRAIEGYNENSESVYLRASRERWQAPYKIEKIHVPNGVQVDKKQIVSQFGEVAKRIELSREKIETFAEHLKGLGIDEFSLEYMLENRRFLFIDWDTNDDERVIRSMIRDKEKEPSI